MPLGKDQFEVVAETKITDPGINESSIRSREGGCTAVPDLVAKRPSAQSVCHRFCEARVRYAEHRSDRVVVTFQIDGILTVTVSVSAVP